MSIIEKALNKAKDQGREANVATDFSRTTFRNTDRPRPVNQAFTGNSYEKNSHDLHPSEVVEIDWKRLAELGFVTPDDINTQTIEEYRNIKRPLVSNAFGKSSLGIERSNLILVTSSVPGEGKTFTAINLALSIANERDKNVLLIDADVARPSVSKTLGIKSSPGLIEYLESPDMSFSEIVLATNMPGLSVVPAGKKHKYSTELLSSNKMSLLAQELSTRYPNRMVIFDSPPLLAATQGEVLATKRLSCSLPWRNAIQRNLTTS